MVCFPLSREGCVYSQYVFKASHIRKKKLHFAKEPNVKQDRVNITQMYWRTQFTEFWIEDICCLCLWAWSALRPAAALEQIGVFLCHVQDYQRALYLRLWKKMKGGSLTGGETSVFTPFWKCTMQHRFAQPCENTRTQSRPPLWRCIPHLMPDLLLTEK